MPGPFKVSHITFPYLTVCEFYKACGKINCNYKDIESDLEPEPITRLLHFGDPWMDQLSHSKKI